jgi:hypothetical protein
MQRGGTKIPRYEVVPRALDLRRYHDRHHLCRMTVTKGGPHDDEALPRSEVWSTFIGAEILRGGGGMVALEVAIRQSSPRTKPPNGGHVSSPAWSGMEIVVNIGRPQRPHDCCILECGR